MDLVEESNQRQWPSITYEELPWKVDVDDFTFMSKTRRRKMSSTYKAAIPFEIAQRALDVPRSINSYLDEMLVLLVRFDAQQVSRGYDLPALLLRSESAASSQIEHLTSSVRNVALAELSSDAPHNAKIISGNVAAMRTALGFSGMLDTEAILAIHEALMSSSNASFAGSFRKEPVWVGGDSFSPHGALFVPPDHVRLPALLEDFVRFCQRDDIHPIAKAAIAHAQFETLHPFIDGNGRTGRTLLHKILRDEGVLAHATLPVSAGLLHNVDAYMDAIAAYQNGNPLAVIEQVLDALDVALVVGDLVSRHLDEVFASWSERMSERKNAAIWKLPALLAEQPVVSAAFISEKLSITTRAASSVIAKAQQYGILRPVGAGVRSVYYQADDLLSVLEEASSVQGIRRMMAR